MLRGIRTSRPLFTVIVFSLILCIRVLPSSSAPLAQTSEDFVEVQRLRASDGTPDNSFGQHFEVEGNTLLATSNNGLYIFGFNGTQWSQQAKLTPSDGVVLQNGTLRGDTAVGVPNASIQPNNAYVFTRSGTTWTQQAILTPSPSVQRYFSKLDFLDDNTLLLSLYPSYDLQLNGAVYIYTRSGTTWTLQDILSPSDGVYNQDFGQYLVLDSNTILVSADSGDAGYLGAVYIYTRSGSDWTEQGKFTASDGVVMDRFGNALAAEGSTLIVSAPMSPHPEYDDGAVYVFNRSGNTFTEQQKLTIPNTTRIRFGAAVDLDGDSLLIGAPYDDNTDGAVYEFIRSGNTWVHQAKLTPGGPSSPNGQINFGEYILREGNLAIMGSSGYAEPNDTRGRVYVFEKNAGVWSQTQILRPNDNLQNHRFGAPIALQGDTMFIGAPAGSSDPARQGEIHIYERGGTPTQQELLVNGGFEGNQTNGVPNGWMRKNTTKDERRCNKPNEGAVAFLGNCAYFMKGSSSTGGKLAQNVNLSQFNLKAGDIVRLNGFYNKQSTGSVYVYLYVNYANFPEEQRRIILTQPTANQWYQAINQSTITLKETPTRIRVVLENKTTSGKTWFDAMSLTATTGSQNTLLSVPFPVDEQSHTESLIPLP